MQTNRKSHVGRLIAHWPRLDQTVGQATAVSPEGIGYSRDWSTASRQNLIESQIDDPQRAITSLFVSQPDESSAAQTTGLFVMHRKPNRIGGPSPEDVKQVQLLIRKTAFELRRHQQQQTMEIELATLRSVTQCLPGQLETDFVDERLAGVLASSAPKRSSGSPTPHLSQTVGAQLEDAASIGQSNGSQSHRRFYKTHQAAIIDQHDKQIGTSVLHVDITEQHEVIKALQRTQQRYQLAIAASKTSIWEWNLSTNQVINDGNLFKLLGYSDLGTVDVEYWKDKIHPDDLSKVMQATTDYFEGNTEQLQVLKRFRHADGSYRWFEVRGHFVHFDGEQQTVVGSDRDVTEQVVVNQKIEQLQEELVRLTRDTTAAELSASLAHEIIQPVTAICSYSAAVKKTVGRLSEQLDVGGQLDDVRRYISEIENNATETAEILNAIRSVITAASIKLVPHTLESILEQVVLLHKSEFAKQGIEISFTVESPQMQVWVHHSLIIHALSNLLVNARQAIAEQASPDGEIRIHCRRCDSSAIIEISDSGNGICDAQLDRLFQPFYTTRHDGMGMGLAIVKRIIESHRGSVTVSSPAGQGACFRIQLPV